LAVDSGGTSDPLAALFPSNNPQDVKHTRMIRKMSTPKWNQCSQFDVGNFGDDSLHVDVYACNAVRRDQKIGEVGISSRALCWTPGSRGSLEKNSCDCPYWNGKKASPSSAPQCTQLHAPMVFGLRLFHGIHQKRYFYDWSLREAHRWFRRSQGSIQ
jgi:hypothetical protein